MKKRGTKTVKLFTAGLLWIVFLLNGHAQDFHLSHFEANPMYLNPALTGARMQFDWDYRAHVNYRSQWKKMLGKPYTTVSAGYDMPFKDQFSTGAFIINNKGATGTFNTLNFILSGSYKVTHKDVDKKRHHLYVGLQLGLIQKTLNSGTYYYDTQYSPTGNIDDPFDKSLPSGEDIAAQEKLLKFDANMGIFYKYIDKEAKVHPFGGISIYHITRPDESFTGYKSKMPMRFTYHGGCDYKVNELITVVPQFMIMRMARAMDLNIGVQGFYKIQETDYEPMLGVAWRRKDAIAIHLGLKQKNNMYRISYDVNTSYLDNFTRGRGAIEFSVIYTGKFKTPRVLSPMFE